MNCYAKLPCSGAEDADLLDAQRRFESHVLRTSQVTLERYRLVGRGSARMMRGVHAAYVAELRIIIQFSVWQRGHLLEPWQIGVHSPRGMIAALIERMKESRQEYISSEGLALTVGAMFLWWHEHCARHAPECLEADVLVRGDVTDVLIEGMARLVWSLRHLGTQKEAE